MKQEHNPFDIHRALLRKFPKWTHPFWNYLMALRPQGEPRKLRWTATRHLLAVLLLYLGGTALGIWSMTVLLGAITGAPMA